MIEVALGELQKDELKFAAALLGRAFRDNPTMVAMIRGGPYRRMIGAQRGFGGYISLLERPPLVARRGEILSAPIMRNPP